MKSAFREYLATVIEVPKYRECWFCGRNVENYSPAGGRKRIRCDSVECNRFYHCMYRRFLRSPFYKPTYTGFSKLEKNSRG